MKKLIIILLLQGVFTPCNNLFSQESKSFLQSPFFQKVFDGNNRLSISVGLFHQFLDGTPIVNKERIMENKGLKSPMSAFGGYLNDSWGWNVKRTIRKKSSLILEYMLFKGAGLTYSSTWIGPPRLLTRKREKYSFTYLRLVPINDKIDFNIGLGVNYQWGVEIYALISPPHYDDFYDKYYFGGERKDLGLNLKAGFEYTPIKRITLSAGVDWTRSIFTEALSHNGIDTYTFFFENYGMTQFPSKNDISFNLGIGVNF